MARVSGSGRMKARRPMVGHGQLREAGHNKGPEPAGVGMKASSGDGTWRRGCLELQLVAPGVPGEAAAVDLSEEDGSGRRREHRDLAGGAPQRRKQWAMALVAEQGKLDAKVNGGEEADRLWPGSLNRRRREEGRGTLVDDEGDGEVWWRSTKGSKEEVGRGGLAAWT
ncbi:hypothetical protein TRIUR3_27213 [Triticum urartu]|uniref:DUF834 domain-containing protein n=1 Tax=Triticum urartu TaxID=4572 RepID=M7YE24_TRIUA|nr:hypothetical protein TRIUR3_27213 [Triticum urartu]